MNPNIQKMINDMLLVRGAVDSDIYTSVHNASYDIVSNSVRSATASLIDNGILRIIFWAVHDSFQKEMQ